MNVLQVNKFFFVNGGSETVFFLTRDLLARHGHTVLDFSMTDDRNLDSEFARLFAPRRHYTADGGVVRVAKDAGASIYSRAAKQRLAQLLDERHCDVAHLHLIYHQLTLSILDELSKRRIPIVMTAHDYKVACPAYTLFRNGEPCRRCVAGSPRHVIGGRCVKNSLPASLVAYAEAKMARWRRLYDKVDRWIAPSQFCADVLVAAGVEPSRIVVLPNFIPDTERRPLVTRPTTFPRFLYAGRFERTKGVHILLEAFKNSEGELGVLALAGSTGSLTDLVVNAAADCPYIEYLGPLDRTELWKQLGRSTAAVLPALWEENQPMSVLEARAAGVPVICSDRGGLPDMVNDGVDGLVFSASDPASLSQALRALARDTTQAHRLGLAGYDRLARENSETAHYQGLMATYRSALEAAGRR